MKGGGAPRGGPALGGRGPEARASLGASTIGLAQKPSLSVPRAETHEAVKPGFNPVRAPLFENSKAHSERLPQGGKLEGPAGIKLSPALNFARDRLSTPNYEMLKPTADHEGRHIMAGILTGSEVVGFSLKPMVHPNGEISLGRTEIRADADAFGVIAGGGAVGDHASGFFDDIRQIRKTDPHGEMPSIRTADKVINDLVPKPVQEELSDNLIMLRELRNKDYIHGLVDQIFLKYAEKNNDYASYDKFKSFVAVQGYRAILQAERNKAGVRKQSLSIEYLKNRIEYKFGEKRFTEEKEKRCSLCGSPVGHAPNCPGRRRPEDYKMKPQVTNPKLEAMKDHSLPARLVGDKRVDTGWVDVFVRPKY